MFDVVSRGRLADAAPGWRAAQHPVAHAAMRVQKLGRKQQRKRNAMAFEHTSTSAERKQKNKRFVHTKYSSKNGARHIPTTAVKAMIIGPATTSSAKKIKVPPLAEHEIIVFKFRSPTVSSFSAQSVPHGGFVPKQSPAKNAMDGRWTMDNDAMA